MKKKRMMKMANGKSFKDLYQKQICFQRKVEKLNVNYPIPHDDPERFIYHITAMQEEIGEVLKADKRWKTHRNANYDPAEKLDEIADCYITLMNISMWSGFDADTVLEVINKKIAVNNIRIEGK